MVHIVFETAVGERFELEVPAEGSLMEVARNHLVPGILADCGGSMVCGTCHVVIAPEWQSRLPAQSDIEREMLEYVPEPQPNTRLSCQIPLSPALDGLIARIPAHQR